MCHARDNHKLAVLDPRPEVAPVNVAGLIAIEVPEAGQEHEPVFCQPLHVRRVLLFPKIDAADIQGSGKRFRVLGGQQAGNPAATREA